jgi:DNA-binding transcriptional ArsR family regulator
VDVLGIRVADNLFRNSYNPAHYDGQLACHLDLLVKGVGASCSNNWPRGWSTSSRALGDPTRRAIIEKLSEGPVSVSTLARPLHVTLAAVVQHLQVLEKSGLVRTEKIGRVRTCRMQPKGLTVVERWISERRSLWEKRLDRLGAVLAESDGD